MGNRRDETYVLEGRERNSTAKARLIEFTNTGEEAWVPKSQISHEEPTGEGTTLYTIAAWICEKNGWLPDD